MYQQGDCRGDGMYGCALSFALQRIRASMSPTWNSRSVSVFDSLVFRRFTIEPGKNCPSTDKGITKYNFFSPEYRCFATQKGY